MRNSETIEPTTAWTAVPCPIKAPDTRFYSWVDWGAPYGRTVVGLDPMRIPGELRYLVVPINFLA